MGIIYSPMLVVTAWLETRTARQVIRNRERGDSDDDRIEEWESILVEGSLDLEAEGWTKKVESTRPNVETDAAVLEIRELKGMLGELRRVVDAMEKGGGNGTADKK